MTSTPAPPGAPDDPGRTSSGGFQPPYPPTPPAGQSPVTGVAASSGSGFFGALFDFSFSRFITPMIIRFVYLLAAVVIGVMWLVMVISGFTQSAALGLFTLVIGPVIALIYLAFIRMTLEIYLAVVRMSEDIHQRLPR